MKKKLSDVKSYKRELVFNTTLDKKYCAAHPLSSEYLIVRANQYHCPLCQYTGKTTELLRNHYEKKHFSESINLGRYIYFQCYHACIDSRRIQYEPVKKNHPPHYHCHDKQCESLYFSTLEALKEHLSSSHPITLDFDEDRGTSLVSHKEAKGKIRIAEEPSHSFVKRARVNFRETIRIRTLDVELSRNEQAEAAVGSYKGQGPSKVSFLPDELPSPECDKVPLARWSKSVKPLKSVLKRPLPLLEEDSSSFLSSSPIAPKSFEAPLLPLPKVLPIVHEAMSLRKTTRERKGVLEKNSSEKMEEPSSYYRHPTISLSSHSKQLPQEEEKTSSTGPLKAPSRSLSPRENEKCNSYSTTPPSAPSPRREEACNRRFTALLGDVSPKKEGEGVTSMTGGRSPREVASNGSLTHSAATNGTQPSISLQEEAKEIMRQGEWERQESATDNIKLLTPKRCERIEVERVERGKSREAMEKKESVRIIVGDGMEKDNSTAPGQEGGNSRTLSPVAAVIKCGGERERYDEADALIATGKAAERTESETSIDTQMDYSRTVSHDTFFTFL